MKRSLYIGLFLIATSQGFGQVPFFQQYFLMRKNDAIQINAMLQERDGYMWFGTSHGLFSFDGKNHQQYTTRNGLANDVVTALAQDSSGRIWIGYQSGQLGFFQDKKFELFTPAEGNATKPISDILFDSRGNLWFATLNDGLYYFRESRLYRVDEAEGMPDLYIYDLEEDVYGNIWAGTDGGAAVCTLKDNKLSIDVIDYDDGLPDNIIRKIVHEKNNTVLLATEDAGIIRYDLSTRKYQLLLEHAWPYGSVSDFELKGDKVWIACPQKGLVIYDRRTKSERLHSPEHFRGLAAVRTLAQDLHGNIWIGTKSGICRTAGDALQFLEDPIPGGKPNVRAVAVDHQNTLWFSNSDGLFKRALGQDKEISMPLKNSAFRNYSVISLYTDYRGYVWAGLYGEGVLRIDPATGKIKHFRKELRNGNVLSIAGDKNTVWLGTLGGATRITFSNNDQFDIVNFSHDDGLASDFIYQVFIENNRIWFATDGKGVAMMNRDGFHQYTDGLPGNVVYGMAQGAAHRLWVNVQGHGLYTFDGIKFHACDSSIVLRDNDIHALASDKDGNIVVMHDAGIDVIDVRRNKVINLGEEVGIRDKIANLNAIGKDEQGDIYFGTTGGIVKYATDAGYFSNHPKPLLSGVKVFDTPMNPVAMPQLQYDENNVTVQYLGVWYKNPNGLFYAYKLENYDHDWIATRNQEVTYSRLPPGSYTFKLRVSESQNFIDAREVAVAFSISPPVWQTIPFYICTFIILVTSVYVVVKNREKKLRRDNEMLEEKVMLRTREIQAQSDEIQTQNEEISAQSEEILRINENLEDIVQERTRELERKNKALEEYAFINAHKLRSPVATILGLINLISKTKLDHDGAEINKKLQNTADELDSIVSSITKAIERSERKIPKVPD